MLCRGSVNNTASITSIASKAPGKWSCSIPVMHVTTIHDPATLVLPCTFPLCQVIFRNVHKLLVDTATSEFLFCLDFWEDEAVFKELFAPVVAVVEGDLTEQLQVRHMVTWLMLICHAYMTCLYD